MLPKTRWQDPGARHKLAKAAQSVAGSIRAADLLIGMRLHSLIMALSAEVPVIGIAYDPKVKAVMEEFNQPILPYQSKSAADCAAIWQTTIAQTLANLQSGKLAISKTLTSVKSGACQNQAIIAKMLAQ
ncbi:MAG: polysaccharide pyruvyl transferase family protein [Candidatus Obscuribacter sp.]|nr:polysaccharide pyruvyl transferase family protein [Candidatus Obscuribacter sp.]